jgi:hypothetical protein
VQREVSIAVKAVPTMFDWARGDVRSVRYTSTEFVLPPVEAEVSLREFVCAVPYLTACGVFPPRHVLNQILSSGSRGGGMGSGAIWAPFEIDEGEYAELLESIWSMPEHQLLEIAGGTWVRLTRDTELDVYTDPYQWMMAACAKHRSAWSAPVKDVLQRGRRPE